MLDRTSPPKQHNIITAILPTAQVNSYSNGSRLHLIPNSLQPVVRVEVVLNAGKWYEPSTGVSYLLSKMLMEGTTSYSAKKLAEIIAFYGASIDCQQGYDRLVITLYCLSKYLDQLLPVLKEIVESPTIGEKELELQKTIAIQNLQVEKRKNSYLATKRFTQNLFGCNHPYAVGLEEEQINTVEVAQLKSFHRSSFFSGQTEIFLCGDIDESYQKKIEDLLPLKTTPPAKASSIEIKPGPQQDEIYLPDSLQSSIRLGRLWPNLDSPDYHRLSLLNKVLGGYFGSRLMKNIREDKGFTYGIYASQSPKERNNVFMIGTDVNYKSTEQTITEIKKEINALKETPISQDELQTVKAYTIGKFLGDTNTIFEQTDRYKTVVLHNLQKDYYSYYLKIISAARPEELQVLAQEYYILDEFKEVVVGRRA